MSDETTQCLSEEHPFVLITETRTLLAQRKTTGHSAAEFVSAKKSKYYYYKGARARAHTHTHTRTHQRGHDTMHCTTHLTFLMKYITGRRSTYSTNLAENEDKQSATQTARANVTS
jgi:hypothetical protein